MTAKLRNIPKQFDSTHSSKFKNLFVSGCSFTYNNSENSTCTWPYYLRDFVGFDQVYDCSQSGAGNSHIFNSVVNEVETNTAISPESTMMIVMWSGMSRVDVIATQALAKSWHFMSNNYQLDDKFSTLSIFNIEHFRFSSGYGNNKTSDLETMCYHYRRLIEPEAQIYQSMLNIISLYHYLKNKNYNFVFLNYMDPTPELECIKNPLVSTVSQMFAPVLDLGTYSQSTRQLEVDDHPSPDGYLSWTKDYLIPYLCSIDQLQTRTS